jgi:hypothetical protein
VRSLAGAVLTGGESAYIFLEAEDPRDVRSVTFLLDGALFSLDVVAPFDFAGSSLRRPCKTCAFTAHPFESNLLSLGEHRISAVVRFRDGSQTTVQASFTVADTTPHSLVVSSSPDRSAPRPLAGAQLSGKQYLFLGEADDPIAGLTAVVFLLDGKPIGLDESAPYDARGTRRDGTAIALDTRGLPNGVHRLTAIVVLDGFATITYRSDFHVAN